MTHEEIKIEDILVLSPDAWDMSYDLEASQKKLVEALTTYRAQVLEEFRRVVDNHEYEWDGGKSAWQNYLDKQNPTN